MRRIASTYGALLLTAPLVGIVVSRLSAGLAGPTEEATSRNAQCVAPDSPFAPIRQTVILQQPKQAKYYPASWRASRRQGVRPPITTLYTVHLHEALPVLSGQLPPPEVLDHFYRCRGFGTVHPVDPRLTDAVIAAAAHFRADRVEVVSAYRSPKFNDALAKKGRHVAAESKHTRGMAMDIRIVDVPANEVGKWMYSNFEGGVGTYEADDFVHIDTGAKRRWRGR